MADESDIRITAWPGDPLALRHQFAGDGPCPVKLSFDGAPVNVQVGTGETPLPVDMRMDLSARQPVPLCISVCEPICAKSDYTISFDIFDQPVGRILVRGMTRIFNCRDRVEETSEEVCIDFRRRKEGETFPDGVEIGGARFSPVEGDLAVVSWGQPSGQNKLRFPSAGLRIALPQPASRVAVTLINHFGQSLKVTLLKNGTEVESRVAAVDTAPAEIAFSHPGADGLMISGGGNEAAVVRLCWTPQG